MTCRHVPATRAVPRRAATGSLYPEVRAVPGRTRGEAAPRTLHRMVAVLFLLAVPAQGLGQEARRLERLEGVAPEPMAERPVQAEAAKEERPRTGLEEERQRWLLGKIEPALEEQYLAGGDLDVILYLELAPGYEAPGDVRARHLPAIRGLADEVRSIERAYRPDGPLTRAEEELLLPWQQVVMSQADRARRRGLNQEIDQRLGAMRSEVLRLMKDRAEGSMATMTEVVESWGGRVEARIASVNALQAAIPAESLLGIVGHPLVRLAVAVPVLTLELDNSVPSVGYTSWHSNGIDGGAYDAGLVDSGLRADHPYFSGVPIYTDGSVTSSDPDAHGTHVAGIIASTDGTYRGTAFGLDRLFFAQSGSKAAFDNLMDSTVTGVTDTPEVINFSVGQGTANDTDYSNSDAFYDAFVENFDVMITKSAGNEGWGTTTITHPGPAYNLLVVANMDDQGNTGRTGDVRRDSSSVGPTLGGRNKPDITAPGTNIRSANAHYNAAGDCNTCNGTGFFGNTCGKDFCENSGTSMAAPHVAGAIVLLEDGGNNNPAAQKAVLLNTADAWTSNNTSGTGDDGAVSGSYWDKSYGWGYLDMAHAYTHRADYFTDSVVPRNDNATEDDYKLYVGPMFAGDKATLVWTKRSNYSVGDIGASNQFDLSDLDLRLYNDATGNTEDSSTSGINNVEQVAASSTITAVIKVSAFSTSFDNASSEEFALATEEGFTPVPFPVDFDGYGLHPDTMGPGTQMDFSAFVINNGGVSSHDNTLELQALPPGWSWVSGANVQSVGVAEAGGASDLATWRLQARPIDATPPSPSTLAFSVEPHELDTSQIAMGAITATDEHGPVEYYFDFTSSTTGGPGGSDSGWQTSKAFTATGLGANHEYCYRVAARDGLPVTEGPAFTLSHSSYGETFGPDGPWQMPVVLTETPNVGSFSTLSCEFTAIETPVGVTFGPFTSTSIDVRSTNTPDGLDRGSSGLRLFNDTAGTMSAWQQNNDPWTSSGLSPNTSYDFRARSRNGDGTTSPNSPTASMVTRAALPAAGTLSSPVDTGVAVTWTANGNPGGTEYFAENLTLGTNSGWTTSLTWLNGGLVCGNLYAYRVKARNLSLVETAFVPLGMIAAGVDTDGDAVPNCVDPDDDADGVLDLDDCSPLNPAVWTAPGEATSLMLDHTGGASGTTTLTWLAPLSPGTDRPVVYDTLTSADPAVWSPGGAQCDELGSDLTSVHEVTPPVGAVITFLVRAANYCGDGDPGAGVDSTGTELPRSARTCGCEHGICTVGPALDPGCDSCAAELCAVDPYCCDTEWDAICVDRVGQVCGGISCS